MGTKKTYRLGSLDMEFHFPPSRTPEPLSEGSAKVVDDFMIGLDPTSSARVAELEINANAIRLFRRCRSGLPKDKLIVSLVVHANKPTESMLLSVLDKPHMRIDLRYLVDFAAGNEKIDWKSLGGGISASLWMEWAVRSD